jgi:hypothetical protein
MCFQKQTGGDDEIMRNKDHLVAQGFSQVECLDFKEIFALVACLETIRIRLAFVASKGFKLYQMDMKSDFLNCVIQEEVFIRQPPGFENPKFSIECTSFQRLCTCLSKCHEYGMLGLRPYC